jgi:hypothetical protein
MKDNTIKMRVASIVVGEMQRYDQPSPESGVGDFLR